MSAGFTFLGSLFETPASREAYEPLLSMGFAASVLCASGYVASQALKRATNPVVPDSTLTTRGLFDLAAEFLIQLGDDMMGKQNRKYLPFVGTVFLYVLTMNLLGLVPGYAAPTASLGANFGIALIVFVLYNAWGIKEVGIGNYFKHLLGPNMAIAPLFLLIELVSHVFRPASLSLRLFGNMTGDHAAISVFTDLTKVGVPVPFYLLGTFVCFMQAYVFTLLTMVYIGGAVTHEHGDEEHHDHH